MLDAERQASRLRWLQREGEGHSGAHIANQYACLAATRLLGGMPSDAWRNRLPALVASLQQPDGGVCSSAESGGECDIRFIYSAVASLVLAGFDVRVHGTAAASTCSLHQRRCPECRQQANGEQQHTGPRTRSDISHNTLPSGGSICPTPSPSIGIDAAAALTYIRSCQSYEGGFGLWPGAEAHGGSTYCAVATLALLLGPRVAVAPGATPLGSIDGGDGGIDDWGIDLPSLLRWLSHRQSVPSSPPPSAADSSTTTSAAAHVLPSSPSLISAGMCGRSNKDPDACYGYWIGATLAILQRCFGERDTDSEGACSTTLGFGSNAEPSHSSSAESGSDHHGAAETSDIPHSSAASAICGYSRPPSTSRSRQRLAGLPIPSVDSQSLASFLLQCQHPAIGGFAREPDHMPDPLHTHCSVFGLALCGSLESLLSVNEEAGSVGVAGGEQHQEGTNAEGVGSDPQRHHHRGGRRLDGALPVPAALAVAVVPELGLGWRRQPRPLASIVDLAG